MLSMAIRDPDPVLFVEPQRLYRTVRGPVTVRDDPLPFGRARTVRQGTDVTLIAWSAAVHLCLAAATELEFDRHLCGGARHPRPWYHWMLRASSRL